MDSNNWYEDDWIDDYYDGYYDGYYNYYDSIKEEKLKEELELTWEEIDMNYISSSSLSNKSKSKYRNQLSDTWSPYPFVSKSNYRPHMSNLDKSELNDTQFDSKNRSSIIRIIKC